MLKTTNFYHSVRNLEKEISTFQKTVSQLDNILGNFKLFCFYIINKVILNYSSFSELFSAPYAYCILTQL